MNKGILDKVRLCLFTAGLGAVCGAVVWAFLRLVGICTDVIWDVIPKAAGVSWTPVVLCTAGGLLAGLIRRKYGDYPEELQTVLGKVKSEHHYDYRPMAVMLVCAFIPLIFGASVGPEAGLSGVIAGLCYWVGDNVKYAGKHMKECSEVGMAAALGSLFHMPLFGVFTVEEPDGSEPAAADESDDALPKMTKYALYGVSVAAAFIAMKILSVFLGPAGEGIPSFEYAEPSAADYALTVLYIPVGCVLFLLFENAEKITKLAADEAPAVVREMVCGLIIGVMSLIVPLVLFSGEGEMEDLPEIFVEYSPIAMIGICLLKVIMTSFCIQFGLKGGHFFPLIFACACMGFGFASLIFGTFAGAESAVISGHGFFAAAVVTAACMGAQMKKPVAATLLLMLCFPLKYIVWIFAAGAIGAGIAQHISSDKSA